MDSDDPGRKLFTALVALFRPHVEAVEMPKILAWARSPYSWEEKKVLLGFWFTPMAALALMEWKKQKMLLRGISTAAGEAFKAIFNRPRLSGGQIDAMKDAWLAEATAMFVRGWLDTLECAVPEGEGASIDPSILDNAMLPLIDEFEPTGIISMLCQNMTPEEIRGILRAVKASLPSGQFIPSEALELLKIEPLEDPDPLDSFAIVDVDDVN